MSFLRSISTRNPPGIEMANVAGMETPSRMTCAVASAAPYPFHHLRSQDAKPLRPRQAGNIREPVFHIANFKCALGAGDANRSPA